MNIFERYENKEFEIIGKKKLTWKRSNVSFEVVKINIEELKYNVLNGRIAELDLEKDVNLDDNTYKKIKHSIVKQSKGDLEKLAQNIGAAGLKDPLIVNKEGIIIDGNRRYTAINMLLSGEIKPQKAVDIADLEMVDAVILNVESDEQSTKLLEMSLQFDDMKKDYDPISRAFSFATSHHKFGISIEALAEVSGYSKSDILKDIRTVKLIRVYLAAVGEKDNISFAIDLNLDGPMKEIASSETKTNYYINNQKELVDIITLAKVEKRDATRFVREVIKGSAQTANKNVLNSTEVKKQIAKIVEEVDVPSIIKKAASAQTVAEKKEIISNQDENVAIKVSQGLLDLRKSLVSHNKAVDNSRQIDKFLDFVQDLDFSLLNSVDVKKIAKIKEIILQNE